MNHIKHFTNSMAECHICCELGAPQNCHAILGNAMCLLFYFRVEVVINHIENFWSHFKRTIIGTYFQISNQHLDSYVKEATFRYNQRHLSEGSRFDVTLANSNKTLSWNELIARKEKRA